MEKIVNDLKAAIQAIDALKDKRTSALMVARAHIDAAIPRVQQHIDAAKAETKPVPKA